VSSVSREPPHLSDAVGPEKRSLISPSATATYSVRYLPATTTRAKRSTTLSSLELHQRTFGSEVTYSPQTSLIRSRIMASNSSIGRRLA